MDFEYDKRIKFVEDVFAMLSELISNKLEMRFKKFKIDDKDYSDNYEFYCVEYDFILFELRFLEPLKSHSKYDPLNNPIFFEIYIIDHTKINYRFDSDRVKLGRDDWATDPENIENKNKFLLIPEIINRKLCEKIIENINTISEKHFNRTITTISGTMCGVGCFCTLFDHKNKEYMSNISLVKN
jgi:hypothetical protein